DLVEKFLKIFTEIPLEEIAELSKKQGAELNDVKKRLAFAATEIAHGMDAAKKAEEAVAALFGGGNSDNAPSTDLKMKEAMNIVDSLVAVKLFDSKSEARRMVEQGGIQIDGNKITDKNYTVELAESIMVQRGKKVFLKVNVK
ncbi:MAG: tyrosine--tRNA ligase, partial [Alphaproteobacteria bacterium]|nr:tyrosine--tRNA ligase [Alphaproteobacteria bacterium]